MKGKISISQMAAMHGISRQTLLYYDAIGLFHPAFVGENGYRYYEAGQIPYLREIVLLKNLGMSLEDIKSSLDNRSLSGMLESLKGHERELDKRIELLNRYRDNVRARLEFLRQADPPGEETPLAGEPFLKELPPRPILFVPFEGGEAVDRERLHYALLDQWERLYESGETPAGFGTLIPEEAARTGDLLGGAGAFTVLAKETERTRLIPGFRRWEGGLCACLNRYGMPYEPEGFLRLTAWMKEAGYEIAGDISDACIMDTTFYTQEKQVDFCCLQVPCRKV